MKKIIFLVIYCFFVIINFAQAPQKVSYQMVLRNSDNSIVANQQVKCRISILQGSNNTKPLYSEIHKPFTNSNGLTSIVIGNGQEKNGLFRGINWANGPFFIKTETDITGGSNYTIVGMSELMSVPYALYAAKTSLQAGVGIKISGDTISAQASNERIAIDTSTLYINVKDFGAIPNDNINDAAAIDSAIKYAVANGYSTVYFPAGVYISTADTIGIKSGIRYLGYGATIKQTLANTCLFYAKGTVHDINIEGLTFEGLGTDYTGNNSYSPYRPSGILIWHPDNLSNRSYNIRVTNCSFKNFAHSAIFIASSKNVFISNNKIHGISQLVTDDNHNFGINMVRVNDVSISNNQIDGTAQGICMQNDCSVYTITNNIIRNITGQHGIYLSSAFNSIIANNVIRKCANNGILLQLTSANTNFGMEGITISNNVIDSVDNIGIICYRLSGNMPMKNFVINGNVVNGSRFDGGVAMHLQNIKGLQCFENITTGYFYGMIIRGVQNGQFTSNSNYQTGLAGVLIQNSALDSTINLSFNNHIIYEPALKDTLLNKIGIHLVEGKNISFNHVLVRDTMNKMAYSFYSQTNNQSSISIRNSEFLNSPIRLDSNQCIKEYNNNITSSFFNKPTSILQSRLYVNGAPPDFSNNINVTTFNKLVLPSLPINSVPFISDSGIVNHSKNFVWNNAQNNMGINGSLNITSNEASTNDMAVFENTNKNGFTSININRSGTNRYALLKYSTIGNSNWWVGTAYNNGAGNTAYSIGNGLSLSDAKFTITDAGNVGIGTTTPNDKLEVAGDINLKNLGNKLKIATGTNASVGTANLAAGTITINSIATSINSIIFITAQSCSNCGNYYITNKIAGVSFEVKSSNPNDTSTVAWWIIN